MCIFLRHHATHSKGGSTPLNKKKTSDSLQVCTLRNGKTTHLFLRRLDDSGEPDADLFSREVPLRRASLSASLSLRRSLSRSSSLSLISRRRSLSLSLSFTRSLSIRSLSLARSVCSSSSLIRYLSASLSSSLLLARSLSLSFSRALLSFSSSCFCESKKSSEEQAKISGEQPPSLTAQHCLSTRTYSTASHAYSNLRFLATFNQTTECLEK